MRFVRESMTAVSLFLVVAACNTPSSEEVAGMREQTAAAAASCSAMAGKLELADKRLAAMDKRLKEVEKRTDGIGYKSLGWEFNGIRHLTSLDVRALPIEGKDGACKVTAKAEFSGSLPSKVKASVMKDGGEQVFENYVDLSSGSFAIEEVKSSCDKLSKLVLSR